MNQHDYDEDLMCLVFNRLEWLKYGTVFGITEAALNQASDRTDGFIGCYHGVNCFLTRFLPAQ
jgi:hypothetical protein